MGRTKNTPQNRPDRYGEHRTAFEKNSKRIYAAQTCCGICGRPVDFSLKYPNPMAKCIDHIIPVSRGGHPSDIENLQLAHWSCNRAKSNDIVKTKTSDDTVVNNRDLPQSMDWRSYRFE